MPTEARTETFDVRVGVAGRRKNRRFHFQHVAFRKERAGQRIQARPQMQSPGHVQIHAPPSCVASNRSRLAFSHTSTAMSCASSILESGASPATTKLVFLEPDPETLAPS